MGNQVTNQNQTNNPVEFQGKYKVIKIQDLEPVKKNYYGREVFDTANNWKGVKCKCYNKCECKVLCYMENCKVNTYAHSNSFYGAFVQAYNNHEDLVLSPDDVWMIICMHFSKYINDNGEKMRNMFVDHEGKKGLEVVTGNDLGEDQWDEFFKLMIDAIKNNTKDGIVDTLKANFTTTGPIESILSASVVMDSFKQYFDYGRCIPCCGIKNVKFMGTLTDWESVLDRTKKLEKYSQGYFIDSWATYINNVTPILEKFIDTYNNNVDVDFWNKVMNIEYGRLGSGSTSYVSGWILNFFGIYKKVESDEIKSYNINFPVKLDNKLTGVKKTVHIIGGFGGVNKEDGAYRPQLSMIVYHDGVTFG